MAFLLGFAAFLDYKYWININPVPLGPSLVSGFLVFFCWFLAAGIVMYVVSRYFRKNDDLKHGVFRRFARLLLNVGLIGLAILFFAYEQAPILSMRLWFGLLMIYLLVSLVMLIIYVVRDYPRHRADIVERERLKKYLPGTKRK